MSRRRDREGSAAAPACPVPAGTIVGFFSDAYHAEWCYPTLWLVKRILGDLLLERVSSGWYRLEDALAVVQTVLFDAPRRIYGTG